MKKSLMHPEKFAKNVRMSFSKREEIKDMPNLIGIQADSFVWFVTKGIIDVFKDIFPIEDPTGKIRLDFVEARLKTEFKKDEKRYDREECKQRNATYAYPLYARFRLIKKDRNEVVEHEVYMSDLPYMTPNHSSLMVLKELWFRRW